MPPPPSSRPTSPPPASSCASVNEVINILENLKEQSCRYCRLYRLIGVRTRIVRGVNRASTTRGERRVPSRLCELCINCNCENQIPEMEDQRGNRAGDDDEPEEPENIIINEVDGLPNVHPSYAQLELDLEGERDHGDSSSRSLTDMVNDEDLPTSVIVTNVDPRVFKNDDLKAEIEELFKKFGDDTTFQYFRSFRRMRVNFSSPGAAAHARIQMHLSHFGETDINCYFAQPVTPIDIEDQHLQPPALTKQFLISPPTSPPVGWEPREEGEPLVNHDLLAAIANLSPGCSHELHPGGSGQPGIYVHVCETSAAAASTGPRIQPTRCPEK